MPCMFDAKGDAISVIDVPASATRAEMELVEHGGIFPALGPNAGLPMGWPRYQQRARRSWMFFA